MMSLVDIFAPLEEEPSDNELDSRWPFRVAELLLKVDELDLRRCPRGGELYATFVTYLCRMLVLRRAL